MFKFVIAIFAVVNGVPSEQPKSIVTYKQQTFQTLEACMGFAKSDESAALRQSVKEMVMSQRGAIMAKLGCAESDEEDNTI